MSELSPEAIEYFEKVIDRKIQNAVASVGGERYKSKVLSTDKNDVTWIQVPGVGEKIPVDVRLVDVQDEDSVYATFEDGSVIIDGNQSSPAVTQGSFGNILYNFVPDLANTIIREYAKFDYADIANAVIENARIKSLFAEKADIDFANIDTASIDKGTINQLIAGTATIDDLQAAAATIESLDVEALNAAAAYIGDLETESITTQQLAAAAAYITALTAGTITAQDIISGHATITNLDANYAKIGNGKIINADIDFAHVDVANAQLAKVAQLFSVLGMVDDLTVADGHITGKLTAVEIDGDVANISNIHADSLYILGDDGLYYALNVNAMGQAAASQLPAAMQEQLKGGLHGQNIIAGTVTADKIYVTDIAAFGATIAGMVFGTSNGMYTVHTAGKTAVNSPTAGVYSDSSGQFTVGDGANFLTLYKGSDNEWHLDISAENITLGGGRVITDLDVAVTQTSTGADITVNGDTVHLTNGQAGDSVTVSSVKYTTSDTETQPADSAFTDTTVPTVPEGKWLWTKTTYSDGNSVYTKSKQGVSGTPGTSVTVSSVKYTTSDTDTQPADSEFTYTTVPTVAEGKWLWTKTTFSDGHSVYSKAKQGQKGDQGVSVTNVTSTNNTTAGGTSVVTVTLSDGTTKTFNVKNGSNGETAQWYYGTALTHTSGTATLAATSTSGAVVGSMYLNTQTSLVYKCTAVGTNNTWTYAGDLTTGVLDNISVGGRNLLGSTANPSKPTVRQSAQSMTFGDIGLYNTSASEIGIESYDSSTNTLIITSSVTGNRGVSWYTKPGDVRAGEEYTFSCRVKSNVAVTVHTHTAWRTNGTSGADYTGWTSEGSKSIPANTWTDYVYTFKPSQDAYLNWEFMLSMCFSGISTGVTFRVAHAKLERGNVATDWTPAPEDVDALISAKDLTRFSSGSRTIVTEDAADLPLLTLDPVYGESVQSGTPAPSVPIGIACVSSPNMLENSGNFLDTSGWAKNGASVIETVTVDNRTCIHASGSSSASIRGDGANSSIELLPNTTYRWHAWVKFSLDAPISSSAPLHYWVYKTDTRGAINASNGATASSSMSAYNMETGVLIGTNSGTIPAGTWTHVVFTFTTIAATENYPYINFRPFLYGTGVSSGTNPEAWLYRAQLERVTNGGVSTYYPWSPKGSIAIVSSTGSTTYLDMTDPNTGEPIELHSLGSTYRDILRIDSSGHALVEKKVWSGTWTQLKNRSSNSLTFTAHSEGSSGIRYWTSIRSDSSYPAVADAIMKCTHFYGKTRLSIWEGSIVNEVISYHHNINDPVSYINVINNNWSSATEATTWFNNNGDNIIVLIPLDNPYTIDLGYVDMPQVSDGSTVYVAAEVRPVIGGSWWTEAGRETALSISNNSEAAVKEATDIASADATAKMNEAMQSALSFMEQAKEYTNRYLVDQPNGVFVHPKDDDNNGVYITDIIEIVRNANTVAKFGEDIVMGDPKGPHIVIGDDGIDFYATETERVGYVETTTGGESIFYMTKAIVVKNLRFSKWEWRPRMVNGSSSNLSLKWTGKVGA